MGKEPRIDTLVRVKRLIVNADDFGLTAGVNRAIVDLHRRGVVSSTTLMAVAAETAEAVSLASESLNLGVGCHVVLVDGKPALSPEKLPTLVDQASGCFLPTLGKFVRDLFLGRIRSSEIEAEAEAQIVRLQDWGLTLTHIDTHKHTHMFPRVLGPILAAATRRRIRAIRNPFEPEWSLTATTGAPALRMLQVRLLNRFHATFCSLVAKAGLTTTDGAVGVLATGTLDSATLTALLGAMPNGCFELVTHPGYNDSDLANVRTRLLASRELELNSLKTVEFAPDIQLIEFGDIVFVADSPV